MEKIENIQKEDIAAASITKEVPSESEYETETDDEVKILRTRPKFLLAYTWSRNTGRVNHYP